MAHPITHVSSADRIAAGTRMAVFCKCFCLLKAIIIDSEAHRSAETAIVERESITAYMNLYSNFKTKSRHLRFNACAMTNSWQIS
jgi:hypothetical protein